MDNLDAQAAHLTDFATWNRLDQEFHLAIADIAGNPALILARAPITQLLMPALDRFMSSEQLTGAALARHRRILTEIRHGDGEAAELMTRRHVDEFRQAWEQAGLDPQLPIDDLALEARRRRACAPAEGRRERTRRRRACAPLVSRGSAARASAGTR